MNRVCACVRDSHPLRNKPNHPTHLTSARFECMKGNWHEVLAVNCDRGLLVNYKSCHFDPSFFIGLWSWQHRRLLMGGRLIIMAGMDWLHVWFHSINSIPTLSNSTIPDLSDCIHAKRCLCWLNRKWPLHFYGRIRNRFNRALIIMYILVYLVCWNKK